jgi:hypothetical protein
MLGGREVQIEIMIISKRKQRATGSRGYARREAAAGRNRWCVFLATAVLAATISGLRPTPARAALPQVGGEAAPKFAWVPNLLYGIIDSSNRSALDALYDAAFAAGPALVPELDAAAIADDRTAEFAAQSMAFIGGSQSINALANLLHDPRNLDLRRYYYGALGLAEGPANSQILINAIRHANDEPDRVVTDAAIVALTVRSDPSLLPPLQQTETKITDPVIQGDLANAISIIQTRARYLASRGGQVTARSIQQAIHTYFIPAFQSVPAAARGRNGAQRARATGSGPARRAGFVIQHVEYSPDHDRALARVRFEDGEAIAHYWLVLQKEGSGWEVDTAWLGAERERSGPPGPK